MILLPNLRRSEVLPTIKTIVTVLWGSLKISSIWRDVLMKIHACQVRDLIKRSAFLMEVFAWYQKINCIFTHTKLKLCKKFLERIRDFFLLKSFFGYSEVTKSRFSNFGFVIRLTFIRTGTVWYSDWVTLVSLLKRPTSTKDYYLDSDLFKRSINSILLTHHT